MDKLIEDSLLECPTDQQINVLERCLQLLTTQGETRERKEIGWLLLARVLERCSAECLRAAQSRLGKRLADVASGPTLCSAIFVRQLLCRNPQTGELHATTVESIILSLLDQAVRENCNELKEITAEIFAIRYGCSKSDVLISTLEVLLRQKFIGAEERHGLLNVACLGFTQYIEPLSIYLFQLLSTTFEYCRQDEKLDRDKLLTVIELGLSSNNLREFALKLLESFLRAAQKSALSLAPLIASMLVSQLKEPSAALFSALSELSDLYGAGSTLHKHFFVIFEMLRHPLDRQKYGNEAGKLLASVVRSSAYLIQPEILVAVQQTICRQYAIHPFSPIYRSLVTSFLFSTHPLIPPPVQLVRSVLKNYPDSTMSSVCDLICRPRIMGLDANRVSEKGVSYKENESNVAALKHNNDDDMKFGQPLDPSTNEVARIMEEINKATAATITSTVEIAVVEEEAGPSDSPQKRAEPKKRPLVEMITSTTVKKTKKVEPQTVLHEGEQSVDEILDSFVM